VPQTRVISTGFLMHGNAVMQVGAWRPCRLDLFGCSNLSRAPRACPAVFAGAGTLLQQTPGIQLTVIFENSRQLIILV
jgi:hypothetical protein